MKVYCKDCKHFYEPDVAQWSNDQCRHPENWIEVSTARNPYRTEKEKYDDKNRNNNCPDFELKGWLKLVDKLKALC